MAQITINEISQNYTYNIGNNSFCTVALPITSQWGPGFIDSASTGGSIDASLESTEWVKFRATQAGMEEFVATYRGPAAEYKLTKDYSYQMALTLLASGYDVLVCRLAQGNAANKTIGRKTSTPQPISPYIVRAKYPGTFGNTLMCSLQKIQKGSKYYTNMIVYTVDNSGVKTALENLNFVFEQKNATESIPHFSEIESKYIWIEYGGGAPVGDISDGDDISPSVFRLESGKDGTGASGAIDMLKTQTLALVSDRYGGSTESGDHAYYDAVSAYLDSVSDVDAVDLIRCNEWKYTNSIYVYDLLKDKLAYNPNRVISPGWDDQDLSKFESVSEYDKYSCRLEELSPIHKKLLDVAYYSRCATAFIDIPKCLGMQGVYNESTTAGQEGYAQLLARFTPDNALFDINNSLYPTHAALFAPWGTYRYVGTNKQTIASPSFLALMIQRAMILNQTLQYEWALPTNRKHNLNIAKLDYKVNKKLLDQWQKLEGVGVNVIADLPNMGTTLWGNSTLYEVPPATYQALANLSTRLLMNAVEDVVYRVGVSITFQYNNDEAYSKFYAGVTPILDTMKNVGAIDGYYVKVAADINGLDQVNANTVIGKIYLIVNGVINDIVVDLVALPPGSDLTQFQG